MEKDSGLMLNYGEGWYFKVYEKLHSFCIVWIYDEMFLKWKPYLRLTILIDFGVLLPGS